MIPRIRPGLSKPLCATPRPIHSQGASTARLQHSRKITPVNLELARGLGKPRSQIIALGALAERTMCQVAVTAGVKAPETLIGEMARVPQGARLVILGSAPLNGSQKTLFTSHPAWNEFATIFRSLEGDLFKMCERARGLPHRNVCTIAEWSAQFQGLSASASSLTSRQILNPENLGDPFQRLVENLAVLAILLDNLCTPSRLITRGGIANLQRLVSEMTEFSTRCLLGETEDVDRLARLILNDVPILSEVDALAQASTSMANLDEAMKDPAATVLALLHHEPPT